MDTPPTPSTLPSRLLNGGAFFVLLALAGCSTFYQSMIPENPTRVPETGKPDAIEGTVFSLRQPWRDKAEEDFRPARVWVGWTPEALHIRAQITDDELLTKATADNQRMWELGDVFEMFVMVEGRRDYVELHVTPNNKCLHVRLPGVGGRARPVDEPMSFEEMVVAPVGFDSTVKSEANGWSVSATIPAAVLGLERIEPGMRLRVAFARYDVSPGREPVLSTSASHPVISFHRPDEWSSVVLR